MASPIEPLQENQTWSPYFWAIVVLAFLASIPTFVMGLPYFYHDSGYYLLHSKFDSSSILWRPTTFSFLLSFLTPHLNLAFTIFFLNILNFSLLLIITLQIMPRIPPINFLILGLLLLFTSYGMFSNLLLPDIYTGFSILFLSLLFVFRKKIFLLPLTLLTLFMHFSNILVAILFSLFFFRAQKIFLALMLVVCIVFAIFFSQLRDSGSLILYSRFVNYGIASDFLDKSCDDQKYLLCNHRDLPFHIWQWGPETQIGKLGGIDEVKEDVVVLTNDILLSGGIFTLFNRSFTTAFKQLIWVYQLPRPSIQSEDLYNELSIYSKSVAKSYQTQSSFFINESFFITYERINLILLITTFLFLGYLYWQKRIPKDLLSLIFICTLLYILNGVICGFLTDPDTRYSSRCAWVFPYLAMLTFYRIKSERPKIYLK